MTDKTQETWRETGRKAADDAKAQAQDMADAAKATARDMADKARSEAERRAGEGRDSLAEEGGRFASSLRHAADEQDEGSLQRRLLESVAGGVEDLSDSLRGRSFGTMMSDVEGFARRNPAVFLIGAAAAGFAMVRFARASSAPAGYGDDYDDDDFERGYSRTAAPGTAGYAGTTADPSAGDDLRGYPNPPGGGIPS
jgi:vacuolar-type H+-ATPase subunit H